MPSKLSKNLYRLICTILILFFYYIFFHAKNSIIITSKCDCHKNIQIKIDQSQNSYIISIVKEINKKISKSSTRSIAKSKNLTFTCDLFNTFKRDINGNNRPAIKVVAFSLYGDGFGFTVDKYSKNLKNIAQTVGKLYPGWIMRVC